MRAGVRSILSLMLGRGRLAILCVGVLFYSGVSFADTTSEQNSNMGECWCTSCGKSVACQTMEESAYLPVSQERSSNPVIKKSERANSDE